MLNSSSRTAVKAANRLLVTPPRSAGSVSQDSGQGSPSPLTGEVLSPHDLVAKLCAALPECLDQTCEVVNLNLGAIS